MTCQGFKGKYLICCLQTLSYQINEIWSYNGFLWHDILSEHSVKGSVFYLASIFSHGTGCELDQK